MSRIIAIGHKLFAFASGGSASTSSIPANAILENTTLLPWLENGTNAYITENT